jgi:peptidyl-prolyl cis-trans isomerase B (cyclophilin B)
VASSKDRARKLAREKLDRQLARRAGRQRRRRQIQAGLGAALALALIVGGVAWLGGAFDGDEPVDPTATDVCAWTPQNATSNPDLKDVGEPPKSGMPCGMVSGRPDGNRPASRSARLSPSVEKLLLPLL